MDTREYCDNVTHELAGWQEKLDGIVKKIERMSTGEKEKVYYELNGLNIVADELRTRIDGLSKACSLNWKPVKGDDHEVTWPKDSARGFVSESDFGG
jgi:hypothetical protein